MHPVDVESLGLDDYYEVTRLLLLSSLNILTYMFCSVNIMKAGVFTLHDMFYMIVGY